MRPGARVLPTAVLALWLAVTGSASAHPVHASYAEVEWNPRGRTLEVALRLLPEDLEDLLAGPGGRRAEEGEAETDARIIAALNRRFVVVDRDEKPLPLRWVGRQVDLREAWLYFEIPLGRRRPQQCRLRQSLFLHERERQVNTVRVTIGRDRWSWHFTREDSMARRLRPPERTGGQGSGAPTSRR